MTQWINLNLNNRSMLAHQYSVLGEKAGPILLPLVGLTADRQPNEIRVKFGIFKILYRLNYLGVYFVYYHCNITAVLELHFSWL